MNFAEALEFSKKFPACHSKVFKEFIEWDIWDTETEARWFVPKMVKNGYKSDFAN